jgi:hypothetical protein
MIWKNFSNFRLWSNLKILILEIRKIYIDIAQSRKFLIWNESQKIPLIETSKCWSWNNPANRMYFCTICAYPHSKATSFHKEWQFCGLTWLRLTTTFLGNTYNEWQGISVTCLRWAGERSKDFFSKREKI